MQIKKVGRKGQLTLFTPAELVNAAVLYAIKSKNTRERIYHIKKGSVELTAPLHHIPVPDAKNPKKPPGFSAVAKGTVMLGYANTKTDTFFKHKKYAFEVHYESAKDDLGLPDIHVSKAELKLLEHPSKLMKYAGSLSVVGKKPENTPAQRLQAALGKDKAAAAAVAAPKPAEMPKPVPVPPKAAAPTAPAPAKK